MAFYELVGFTQGDGTVGIVTVRVAQGEDEDLILLVMNNIGKFGDHLYPFSIGKFALKHGILEVFPIAVHFFEHLAQPFIIRYIVCHKIYTSQVSPSILRFDLPGSTS